MRHEFFLDRYVYGRINTENNVLTLVTGSTGVGKSYCALKLAEHYDSKFSVDRVVFEAADFIRLVKKLPKGSFIVFDDCGLAISHRKWLSEVNQIIALVVQSFRRYQINTIFTLPSRFYLDKIPRELSHLEIQMIKRGIGVVYVLKKSQFSDRFFTKSLGTIYLKLPSNGLVEAYEEKKSIYLEKLYNEFEDRLTSVDSLLDRKLETDLQRARNILPELIKEGKCGRKHIDVYALKRKLNIAHTRAYEIRNALIDET